jgi:uracil phosphoribosyltransferase
MTDNREKKKGGSATMAVEVLKSRGVPEDRILFLNLIASPEGITTFATKFPRLKVVTAFIDEVSADLDRHCPTACTNGIPYAGP